MQYVPVVREGFFNVTMDAVVLKGKGIEGHFCKGGCFAIIDSGMINQEV